jgi:RNA polymerase sigma factor (sigma-70 family)
MKDIRIDEQELSDGEIWNLFRSGSDSALDYIYQTYFDKLYNYGCQFTQDQSLVEDTLQDLFIELKLRCAHLSPTDKILPYLYSAFRRKIIRFRTKQSRFKTLDSEDLFPIIAGIDELIINDEEEKEKHLRLQKALNELPENYREIIYLFYYENLSYEEIRAIQGFINIKSARNLLYKAINTLGKRIILFFLLLTQLDRLRNL